MEISKRECVKTTCSSGMGKSIAPLNQLPIALKDAQSYP